MKIRTAFVSNSSSSSFVIIGQVSSLEEAIANLETERFIARGQDLDEGMDIFDLDKDMVEFIQQRGIKDQFGFFKVFDAFYDCTEYNEGKTISPGTIKLFNQKMKKGEQIKLYTLERSHHSSGSVNDLKEYYG